jgi:bifunctional ADP-heptose synthase (sugar kinase/adenylyltransferase)
MESIACLEFVDHIISFDEDRPYNCMGKIRPNIRVIGSEHGPEDYLLDSIEQTFYFPRIQGFSTTEEIESIRR